MEFYKLFHKRTNYYSMLEWIDRGFRPELWELHDKKLKIAFCNLVAPIIVCNKILEHLEK